MTKVLLVEDDNNLREIYEARLAAEGYDIATAKDGEDALAVAKQEKPDLVISDVMMPRISGFEMLDILRNTDGMKHTKVIMLTALGQAEDKSRADNLGADRYLVKSQVTLEDIVKAAQELLSPAAENAAPQTDQAAPATESAVPDTSTPAITPAQPDPVTATPEPTPAVAPEPIVAATIPEPAIVTSTEPATNPITPSPTADPVVAAEPAVTQPAPATSIPVQEPPTEPVVTTPPTPDPSTTQDVVALADDQPVAPIITSDESQTEDQVAEPPVAPAPVEPPATVSEADPVIQMPQPALDPEVAAVTNNVQSSLQETADVEQQIKDFENTEQPATITTETAEATPTATPEVTPTVDTPASVEPGTAQTVQPTEPAIVAEPAQVPATSEPSVSQIPGKLVIQPPTDHANEADISALVAQEEYQEQTAAGLAGAPVVSAAPDQPATPEEPKPVTPQPGGVFMPNTSGSANDTAL